MSVAQYSGAVFVGPAVRWLFGEPTDFLSDYTSGEALLQAVLVQLGTWVGCFYLAGILRGARGVVRRPTEAFWLVNPVTVLTGLILFFDYHQRVLLEEVPYEYVGVFQWGFHLCGVGVYARAFLLGVHAVRPPSSPNVDSALP